MEREKKPKGRALALVLALACTFSLMSVSVLAMQAEDSADAPATAEEALYDESATETESEDDDSDGTDAADRLSAATTEDDADENAASGALDEAVAALVATVASSDDDGIGVSGDEDAAGAADAEDADGTDGGDAAGDSTLGTSSATDAADDPDDDAALETASVTSVTIACTDEDRLVGTRKYAVAQGDVLHFAAYDQDGNELDDVTWSWYSTNSVTTLDSESGDITVTTDIRSGNSSLIYPQATYSDGTTTVSSSRTSFTLAGYKFSSTSDDPTYTLDEDGQDETTFKLTGGVSGYTSWSYDEQAAEGVAELTSDLDSTSNSISFTAVSPGKFDVTVVVNGNEELTDTTTVTIAGVLVQDEEGQTGKIYLDFGEGSSENTEQLSATVAEEQTVSGWSSSDESIATVDENGLVTAAGNVGKAIVYASSSDGTKGGIQVVCVDGERPYFDNIEFTASQFTTGDWVEGETFQMDQYEYEMSIKSTSTTSLTLKSDTAYDDSKYTATATYVNDDGDETSVDVNNGSSTSLADIGYGDTVITITISAIDDPDFATEYHFTIYKARATNKNIKSTTGIVVNPGSRDLLDSTYNGYAEGTIFKANSDGSLTGKTGVASSTYYYRTYLQEYEETFTLSLATYNSYGWIRYSIDGGDSWTDVGQGSGDTDLISYASDEEVIEVTIQILDDATYMENLESGTDGFGDGSDCNVYTIWVERVVTESVADSGEDESAAYMLTATADEGTWCSDFDPEESEYYIVAPYGTESVTIEYTIADGAKATVSSKTQTAGDDGVYTTTVAMSSDSYGVTSGSTTVTVTSESGETSLEYEFNVYNIFSENTADAVAGYLCMGSEFTNSIDRGYYNGIYPALSLTGEYSRHVGNFGGYITYYFEDALVDDAANEYGVDFYIYGDCYDDTRLIWAEPGQVYVSEDGDTWYALAGSEHYEEGTLWDYTITYERNDDDEAIWYDSLGNVMDTTLTYYYWAQYPTPWPSSEYYDMDDAVSEADSYTYTGILISDVVQSNTMANYPTLVDFGYVDCYGLGANGKYDIGASVNPYTATGYNNGFDLAWAVDDDGNPIDVSEMEFHYVKVATASNIWAGIMDEKGTDVSMIVRADATDSAVGETDTPESVTISCGGIEETVELVEGQQVYEVEVDATGDASVTVNGTASDDAIWVNSESVDSGEAATGFTVTSGDEELVRVIVQNGEKEPVLFLLRISGN